MVRPLPSQIQSPQTARKPGRRARNPRKSLLRTPPGYFARPRPAKSLTLQHEVLDGSSIVSYYKEARHGNELKNKRVLPGGAMTTAAVEIPGYVTGSWT